MHCRKCTVSQADHNRNTIMLGDVGVPIGDVIMAVDDERVNSQQHLDKMIAHLTMAVLTLRKPQQTSTRVSSPVVVRGRDQNLVESALKKRKMAITGKQGQPSHLRIPQLSGAPPP